MARPKKPPRVRVQVVFEREQAKRLRKFAKDNDREISAVVRASVDVYIRARSLVDSPSLTSIPEIK